MTVRPKPFLRDRIGARTLLQRAASVFALCVALLAGVNARAAHPLEGDATEKKLLATLRQGKLIRAREQAEKLLRQRPSSMIARYALSQAFFEEEANLPRALYHLLRVEKSLLARFGRRPRDPLAQKWHRRVLLDQERLLGEMDKRREQLAALDRYDALYEPKQDARRIWPLMKLHRFGKARKLAKKLTLSSDLSTRISGYNGLLSIEFEQQRPRRCFEVALKALESIGYASCVLALNTAEAAFAVFKFDEVERLAQKSIQAPTRDCPASAHPHLANLYLARADFQRAIAAVKAAREAGVQRRHRQQFEMTLNAWLMRLLYALGKFDKALQLAKRVVRAPDRMGLTSFSGELMDLIHTVDYHAALSAEIERLRERASVRPLRQRAKLWLKIKRHQLDAWRTRRKATTLLSRGNALVGLLRPYIKPLPPWQTSSLIAIAGHGVTAEGLRQVMRREPDKRSVAPYFDAWRGEMAYRDGQLASALSAAQVALKKLPKDEVLLRGRVLAWSAAAALRTGRTTMARDHFDAVLYRWPTALRLLGVALPVRISSKGGGMAARVGKRLGRSRRLSRGNLGFAVSVIQSGQALRTCLYGPRGRRYACAVVDLSKLKGDDEQRLAAVIDRFHDEIFAPKVDLTQHDINSLDGSAVRGRADEVLKEVLGQ